MGEARAGGLAAGGLHGARLWRRGASWRISAVVACFHDGVSAAMEFVVGDSMIAISGAAAADSATRIMTLCDYAYSLVRMIWGWSYPSRVMIGLPRSLPRWVLLTQRQVHCSSAIACTHGDTCNSVSGCADGLPIALRPSALSRGGRFALARFASGSKLSRLSEGGS